VEGGWDVKPEMRREQLAVEVKLLPDPCLWCWEIRDAERGHIVESSWEDAWTAYASREDAETEGQRRLVRRTTKAPAGGRPGTEAGHPDSPVRPAATS
jgi:hypothetical protein